MEGNGITPVMNVGSGYGDGFGFGGGSGLWLFAILALMWGGNGFFGNRGDGRCATVEDLNNSANFTRLENQVSTNGVQIAQKADALGNGIASLGYEMASQFGNTNMAVKDCCCATQLQLANTNAHIDTATQKVIDTIQADKIASLQAQVSELKTQNLFCGVPRISPYFYGIYPYGNGSCSGNY